jgi:hypothetical protein
MPRGGNHRFLDDFIRFVLGETGFAGEREDQASINVMEFLPALVVFRIFDTAQ